MFFEYACLSVTGRRRANEDSWISIRCRGGIAAAVADGIGGHPGGEIASALAVQAVADAFSGRDVFDCTDAEQQIRDAHQAAHESVSNTATGEYSGMGTTLVSVFAGDGCLAVGNTGDSRCYLVHKGEIACLTVDDTLVGEMVSRGILGAESAETHSLRHVLSRSVGQSFGVTTGVYPLSAGDRVILCSDGLHSVLSDQVIRAISESHAGVQAVADALIQAALGESMDNITVVVIQTSDRDAGRG